MKITQKMREDLLYGTYLKDVVELFPEDPYINVLFFDLDNDGIPEALVSYDRMKDGDTCFWSLFKYQNNHWNRVPTGIYAAPTSMFVFKKTGERPKLFKCRFDFFNREGSLKNEHTIFNPIYKAYQIVIGENGHLDYTVSMPEVEFVNPYDFQNVSVPEIKAKSPDSQIERIPIESIYWKYGVNIKPDTEKQFVRNTPILTRNEILQLNPVEEDFPDRNRDRLYTEVDLNDNGLMDIIISDDYGTMGTGGIGWTVYICIDTNQYKELDFNLGSKMFAVEENTRMGKKLWTYWRIAGNWGSIQYLHQDNDDEWKLSNSLDIHVGDGGSDIGNGIMDAVFNKDNVLPIRMIRPASSTNDLPYVDIPW